MEDVYYWRIDFSSAGHLGCFLRMANVSLKFDDDFMNIDPIKFSCYFALCIGIILTCSSFVLKATHNRMPLRIVGILTIIWGVTGSKIIAFFHS